MKEIPEQWLELEIKKARRKHQEYLEADRNEIAKRYETRIWLLESIYSLVEDGYKYRKQNENIKWVCTRKFKDSNSTNR